MKKFKGRNKVLFKTKKPIVSLIAMLLCVSMLVGMTFAWFTDSFAANKNIESGKLDVEMYWTKDMSSGVWLNAGNEKDGVPIDEKNWEPGYTIVRYVKIVNAGDSDREGEIIIRLCVENALKSPKPFYRLWLPDQTPKTVRKALSEMKEETK